MATDFSFDTIRPEEGDVILVKLFEGVTEPDIIAVGQALQSVFPKNHAMMMPPGMEIETANEEAMKAAGWIPIT